MRSPRVTAALAGIWLAVLGLSEPRWAHAAQPRPVRLFVSVAPAAAACPNAERLQAAVEAQRSRAEGQPLDFAIAVDRVAGSYVATVRVTGTAGGVRVLSDRSPTCAALYEALAVTLALVADPEPAGVASTRSPSSAGSSNARPTGNEPHSVAAHFGVTAAYTTRVTAAPVLALGGALEARTGAWAFELGFRHWQTSQVERHPGITVELMGGRAAGCLLMLGSWSTLWLRGCTSAQVGSLTGTADQRYENSTSHSRPWFAAGAALQSGGSLFGPLGWHLTAEAFAPLRRETFSIRGPGEVFGTEIPGVWIGLGADARIW